MTSAAFDHSDDLQAPPSTRGGVRWLEAAAVVAALALAALIVGRPLGDVAIVCVVGLAVAALVAWIVVQDFRTFTIADGATAAIAVLAIAFRWSAGDTALAMGLDCLLTGGVLLAFREIYFRRRGFDGLGLGDVKLAAAGGLLVGALAFAWVLLAASVVGLLFVAGTGRIGAPIDRSRRLAFGAILAPAIWLAWAIESLPVLLPAAGS